MSPLRRSSRLLALSLAAALLGCGYHSDDHYYDDDGYYYPDEPSVSCGDVVEQAIIDTGELLDVDAGVGAGLFIEYEAGGTYHVTTACDVETGGECTWDVVVSPLDGEPLYSAGPVGLEEDDSLSFVSDDALSLVAYTGTDFDGFTLQTEPGAALRVDALLDNGCGNRYLFWVGDGALHSGAPSNPIDLIPSAP